MRYKDTHLGCDKEIGGGLCCPRSRGGEMLSRGRQGALSCICQCLEGGCHLPSRLGLCVSVSEREFGLIIQDDKR